MPDLFYGKKLPDGTLVRSIRKGLVMAIPIVMIGSFSLVFRFFPFPPYQSFLSRFASGALIDLASLLVDATFGMLSVYMALFTALSRARMEPDREEKALAFPLVSLASFAILSGFPDVTVAFETMGIDGMFTAIVAALLSTSLFDFWSGRRLRGLRLYSDGADADFSDAVSVVLPSLLAVATVALLDLVLVRVLHVTSLQALFVDGATRLFSRIGSGLPRALSFVLASSSLWFFGVHGSNVLEGVSRRLLEPAMAANLALTAQGQPPAEIVSKTFIDVFVLMGGCGSSLCLLLALILFSRDRGDRALSKIAFVPMLFNVNELMLFGLPVVYNLHLLVPFIVVPLLTTLLSYGAMALGFVPLPSRAVPWTTPVFLGGYLATGSLKGSLLQGLNLVLGLFVYRPFIVLYEEQKLRHASADLNRLVGLLERSEETLVPVHLMASGGALGLVAKRLASDLKRALERHEPALHYQPQYDDRGRCVGSEALLRWNHGFFGKIYPPLAVRLAEEAGFLYDLECYVLRRAVRDMAVLRRTLGRSLKTCVNVTVPTFYEGAFEAFLGELIADGSVGRNELWIEITEQKALLSDRETEAKSRRIRAMGFPLVIDDFSMGHTSIKYLQNSAFDMVKLDGSLVRGLKDNPRCGEIIATIVSLSRALDFTVLGECVETKEQQSLLERLGCTQYQGYLYSPAVPFEDFLVLARESSPREKGEAGKR